MPKSLPAKLPRKKPTAAPIKLPRRLGKVLTRLKELSVEEAAELTQELHISQTSTGQRQLALKLRLRVLQDRLAALQEADRSEASVETIALTADAEAIPNPQDEAPELEMQTPETKSGETEEDKEEEEDAAKSVLRPAILLPAPTDKP